MAAFTSIALAVGAAVSAASMIQSRQAAKKQAAIATSSAAAQSAQANEQARGAALQQSSAVQAEQARAAAEQNAQTAAGQADTLDVQSAPVGETTRRRNVRQSFNINAGGTAGGGGSIRV